VANNRGAAPSFSLTGNLEALEALPFLRDAAGFERLRGIGTISLDVLGSGDSPAAIMESLSGQGRFDFSEGAIVGINLARMIRGVLTALETRELPQAIGEQQETDFSALSGSLDFQNGVALNRDLALLSPLLRVNGQGNIDLGARAIEYRLTPRAVASLTGQGGQTDLQGIPVPILIRGDLLNPQITLDFPAIAQNLVRARAQGELGELGAILDLDRVREQGAGGLLDILTGAAGRPAGEPGPEDEPQTAEDEPASDEDRARDLIRGLIGEAARRAQETEDDQSGEGETGGETGGDTPNR